MDLNIRAIFGRFIVLADFHNSRGRPQVTGLKAETDMIAAYQTLHDFKASMNERVGSMEARTKELEQERTVLHGMWVQLDPRRMSPTLPHRSRTSRRSQGSARCGSRGGRPTSTRWRRT